MTDERTAQAIEEMVQRLVEHFSPDQIILFGSHARGTERPGSDVDLPVVMPVTGSKREKHVEMRAALHDITVPKDIILATPEEVARDRDLIGTIIRPALREGKVLYVRPLQVARRVRHPIRKRLPMTALGAEEQSQETVDE